MNSLYKYEIICSASQDKGGQLLLNRIAAKFAEIQYIPCREDVVTFEGYRLVVTSAELDLSNFTYKIYIR